MTMTVQADGDDEAMGKMMGQCKTHMADKHSDMANMSDDEMMNMIKGGWQKS